MNITEVGAFIGLSQDRIRHFTNGYKGNDGKLIEPIFKLDIHYTWKQDGNKMVKDYNPNLCKEEYYKFKTRNK